MPGFLYSTELPPCIKCAEWINLPCLAQTTSFNVNMDPDMHVCVYRVLSVSRSSGCSHVFLRRRDKVFSHSYIITFYSFGLRKGDRWSGDTMWRTNGVQSQRGDRVLSYLIRKALRIQLCVSSTKHMPTAQKSWNKIV